ncbi:MAG: DUF362 domain-containing protein [Aigarchaeota archaeon]|nr:DUF362 domain-containing protein [Aigarchaeota archaeon]
MVECHRFGPTTISKLSDPHELKELLVDPWLKSETVIIKPNLVASVPGAATHPQALRVLLEALDSHIIVTESHAVTRSMKLANSDKWSDAPAEDGVSITIKGKKVNWIWLLVSDEGWRWLLRKPDWDWFREGGYWDQIKKEEKAFLDSRGYTDLFKEFDVEYVNITDEVWSGRVADPAEVKQAVESRYKPAFTEKLYGFVPKKLYDLRGSTFISYAKMQPYNSFTLKNMFGLIPDPLRAWWHGYKHAKLGKSIVDINKVYKSLFNVYGICETLYASPIVDQLGEFLEPTGKRYNVVENLGVVAFGRDLVSLDAIFCNLAGFDMNEFGGYLDKAEEVFGAYDREALRESKSKVGGWLSH